MSAKKNPTNSEMAPADQSSQNTNSKCTFFPLEYFEIPQIRVETQHDFGGNYLHIKELDGELLRSFNLTPTSYDTSSSLPDSPLGSGKPIALKINPDDNILQVGFLSIPGEPHLRTINLGYPYASFRYENGTIIGIGDLRSESKNNLRRYTYDLKEIPLEIHIMGNTLYLQTCPPENEVQDNPEGFTCEICELGEKNCTSC